jgi:hypothetical protein
MRKVTFLSVAVVALTGAVWAPACGSNGDGDNLGGEGGLGGAHAGGRRDSVPSRPAGSGGTAEGGAGGEPDNEPITLYCGDGHVGGAEECEPPGKGSCGIDCLWREPVCGNDVREDGEECDPPNGETCNESCERLEIECGNSVVQNGEECDPPDGKLCNDNCYAIECGDFLREGREECDPPNGIACDDKCHNIEPTCGDEVVQIGEQCDPSNGRSCGEDCRLTTVLNHCPTVVLIGGPTSMTIGSPYPISIEALVEDADGDETFVSWRVTSGTISDPSATQITYVCTEEGAQTLEATVRDSDPACAVATQLVPVCYPAEEP